MNKRFRVWNERKAETPSRSFLWWGSRSQYVPGAVGIKIGDGERAACQFVWRVVAGSWGRSRKFCARVCECETFCVLWGPKSWFCFWWWSNLRALIKRAKATPGKSLCRDLRFLVSPPTMQKSGVDCLGGSPSCVDAPIYHSLAKTQRLGGVLYE